MSKPQVVIIAGGNNSRFFPFDRGTHKGFLSVLGVPLIVRQLRNLRDHGYTDIVLVINPQKQHEQQIQQLLEAYDLSDITVTVVVQPEAKGMGDALLAAAPYISGRFTVVSPYHVQAGIVVARLEALPTRSAVVAVETDQPWDYGCLVLDNDRVVGIVEKPERGTEPSTYRVQSLYLLSPDYLEILAQTKEEEYSFESALDTLFGQETVGYALLDKPLPSLKYPWHLFGVAQALFAGLNTRIDPAAAIAPTAVIDDTHGPVIIEAGAQVGHVARIVGPCYIGNNARVGDFSLVRQSVLESESSAGVHSDIARSILFEKASYHGEGFIGDSIIGEQAKIGAALMTANKRFDRQEIRSQVKETKVATGTNALGVILGPRSKVGIRVSTMPGTIVGADSIVYPNQALSGWYAHDTVIRS